MVQATNAGDGIERRVQYGKWREDKPAEEGYSRELVNQGLDPQYYDRLDELPFLAEGGMTLLECFQNHVANRGDEPFLGTRPMVGTSEKGAPVFGDYQWESYRQVSSDVENLANGMIALRLAPDIEGEGQIWRFVGIWAQNRAEWAKTLLACMHYNMTTVGFYDAMGVSQVDYILN